MHSKSKKHVPLGMQHFKVLTLITVNARLVLWQALLDKDGEAMQLISYRIKLNTAYPVANEVQAVTKPY